ncbi:MAG: hypothetical protein K0R16_2509, partial [Nitrososphaeraceae archaeon]|nr:hypothetical protein [Nitrososphaeraceae archaeon]
PTNVNHQNNQIAFSPDGKRLYVGISSATNSGVVWKITPTKTQ